MKKVAIVGVGMVGLAHARELRLDGTKLSVEIEAPAPVIEQRHSNDIRDPRRNFYKTVNKPVPRVRRGRR